MLGKVLQKTFVTSKFNVNWGTEALRLQYTSRQRQRLMDTDTTVHIISLNDNG